MWSTNEANTTYVQRSSLKTRWELNVLFCRRNDLFLILFSNTEITVLSKKPNSCIWKRQFVKLEVWILSETHYKLKALKARTFPFNPHSAVSVFNTESCRLVRFYCYYFRNKRKKGVLNSLQTFFLLFSHCYACKAK